MIVFRLVHLLHMQYDQVIQQLLDGWTLNETFGVEEDAFIFPLENGQFYAYSLQRNDFSRRQFSVEQRKILHAEDADEWKEERTEAAVCRFLLMLIRRNNQVAPYADDYMISVLQRKLNQTLEEMGLLVELEHIGSGNAEGDPDSGAPVAASLMVPVFWLHGEEISMERLFLHIAATSEKVTQPIIQYIAAPAAEPVVTIVEKTPEEAPVEEPVEEEFVPAEEAVPIEPVEAPVEEEVVPAEETAPTEPVDVPEAVPEETAPTEPVDVLETVPEEEIPEEAASVEEIEAEAVSEEEETSEEEFAEEPVAEEEETQEEESVEESVAEVEETQEENPAEKSVETPVEKEFVPAEETAPTELVDVPEAVPEEIAESERNQFVKAMKLFANVVADAEPGSDKYNSVSFNMGELMYCRDNLTCAAYFYQLCDLDKLADADDYYERLGHCYLDNKMGAFAGPLKMYFKAEQNEDFRKSHQEQLKNAAKISPEEIAKYRKLCIRQGKDKYQEFIKKREQ